MIKEEKWSQFGFERDPNDIRFIVIHNTNNYELSARQLFNWLNDSSKENQGTHFIVDKDETMECMPLTWAVYHTGKGLDDGNKYGICIQIVSKLNVEEYLEGEEKAIELIRDLMEEYNLTKNDIYFHNDFNPRAHCPNDIFNIYGDRKTFINNYIN